MQYIVIYFITNVSCKTRTKTIFRLIAFKKRWKLPMPLFGEAKCSPLPYPEVHKVLRAIWGAGIVYNLRKKHSKEQKMRPSWITKYQNQRIILKKLHTFLALNIFNNLPKELQEVLKENQNKFLKKLKN